MSELSIEEMNKILSSHEAKDDFAGGGFPNIIGERSAIAIQFELLEADEKVAYNRISIDLEIVEGEKNAGRHIFETIWLNRESGLKRAKNVINKVLGRDIMTFPEIEAACADIQGLTLKIKGWEKKPQKQVGGKWVTDEDKLAEKGKKQMVSFLGLADTAGSSNTPF